MAPATGACRDSFSRSARSHPRGGTSVRRRWKLQLLQNSGTPYLFQSPSRSTRAGSLAYMANEPMEVPLATRNVVLTEAQSQLIDRLVTSGRFQNASEALRAGLRLLELEEAELGDLRARLKSGLEQARSGDLAEGSGEQAIRRAFAAARAAS